MSPCANTTARAVRQLLVSEIIPPAAHNHSNKTSGLITRVPASTHQSQSANAFPRRPTICCLGLPHVLISRLCDVKGKSFCALPLSRIVHFVLCKVNLVHAARPATRIEVLLVSRASTESTSEGPLLHRRKAVGNMRLGQKSQMIDIFISR